MEFQGDGGFLSSLPPKLEDAGLEDCALPIEGIQEAFRIAAEKAQAAADGFKVSMKSKAEDIGGCVLNPAPINGDLKDTTIEATGTKPADSCVEPHTGGLLEDGKDAVVDPLGEPKEDKLVGGIDVEPKLGEEGCLKGDPLEPVGGIPEPSAVTDDDGEEEPKGPTLTEAFL